MRLFALDSDTFSLMERAHPIVSARVAVCPVNEISVPVIVVEEMLSGWYSMIRKARTPPRLARFENLNRAKLNVGANDLRIAAIALEYNATVVTRNIRDFNVVPGLNVEDWSKP